MKATELGWGLKLEGFEAPALWGARAIFTGRVVDFLWDRQDLKADDPAAKTLLMAALNGTRGSKTTGGALAAFKRAVDSGKVEVAEGNPPSTLDVKGVRFVFSERESHGYLYVTAFLFKS